ncbi:hypothetical protein IMCC20628_00424 [Hoeflea sp. IMCC20628]|uniref:hypothetical protein n=1 Tax=Hoeflea sp. IMCC20628 TaxID=1620421 RepID=UPI00063ADA92|nr:hypothetical protein [Hoeflea sp. IMCC20628]AKH99150.1 hypothetical protein IMCC20628_00424 [Hoeflea sp. IMCC20628]
MTFPLEPLTSPERICLQLAARGRAHDIKTGQHNECQTNANTLIASACRKLMADTTIEAVARALKLGLIQ